MSEMVVPKSSHDRFCSKKSSPKPRSTITTSESGKKGLCQECPGTRPNMFLRKSMDVHVLKQNIYPILKMPRPKVMPWSTSIHWNAPVLVFLNTHQQIHEISELRPQIHVIGPKSGSYSCGVVLYPSIGIAFETPVI